MHEKIDFKSTLDSYRAKPGTFCELEIAAHQYLMIDGTGDPNTTAAYPDALAALYPVAYRLKFMSKRELGRDYVVPPIEGLWWADDMAVFTVARDKTQWQWTMLIIVPDWIDHELFQRAVAEVGAKQRPASLDRVRYETLTEGRCVQTLHVGSYDDEGPVLERLRNEYLPENGLQAVGKHHEIYLSDARRVEPEKLRTILRQPVSAGVETQE